MELLYLYLDNFKNIQKQGFCFSGEFLFNTKIVKGEIEIDIRENKDYVSNFFGNQQLKNVTAIIGQNGSGKSNIIDFLKTKLADGAGGFDKEAIIIYREKEYPNVAEKYIIVRTPKLKLIVHDKTNKRFVEVLMQPNNETGPFRTKYSVEDFGNISVIYYSNIVDLKIPTSLTNSKIEYEEEPTSVTGCLNISTLAMLSADQQNFTENPQSRIEKVDAYKAREFSRNIEFIISNHRKLLPFDLPEKLFVYILLEDEKNANYSDELKWVNDLMLRFEKDLTPSIKNAQGFLNMLVKSALYNMFTFNKHYKQFKKNEHFFTSVKGDHIYDYMMNLLEKIIMEGGGSPSNSLLHSKAFVMKEFLNYVYEYLITNTDSVFYADEYVFAIPINTGQEIGIKKFIELYVDAKGFTDFLNFKFRNLSSGEQSMLTMISRFYKISIDSTLGLRNDLMLLIDEGDIYFHPEWQRTFLDVLLGYLPVLWPNKNFQLILTSNTPYLASDLPDYNVIRLHHKQQKVVATQTEPLIMKTFGANIHTLLADSFYVTNFIGEFAKKKIEALAAFLLSKKSKEGVFDQFTSQKTINLIGEPIIRNRLQDMYDTKFEIKNEDLKNRRDRLKRELDELNRLIDYND